MQPRADLRADLKAILNAYLNLYIKKRGPRDSFSDQTQYMLEKGKGIFTGSLPVTAQIDKIISSVKDNIDGATEFEDFYNLIVTLRTKAEEAQSLKWRAEEDSLLRVTLHALADIVILNLSKEPAFIQKVLDLKKLYADTETLSKGCLDDKKQGKGLEDQDSKLISIAYDLAQLGEIDFIRIAKLFKKFENFIIPKTKAELDKLCASSGAISLLAGAPICVNLPIQVQKGYSFSQYTLYFQPMEEIDYARFIELAPNQVVKNHQEPEKSPGQPEKKALQRAERKKLQEPEQKAPSQELEQQAEKKQPSVTTHSVFPKKLETTVVDGSTQNMENDQVESSSKRLSASQ